MARLLIPERRRRTADSGHVDRPYGIFKELVKGFGRIDFANRDSSVVSKKKDPASVLGRTARRTCTRTTPKVAGADCLACGGYPMKCGRSLPRPCSQRRSTTAAIEHTGGRCEAFISRRDAIDAGGTVSIEQPVVNLLRDRGLIGA